MPGKLARGKVFSELLSRRDQSDPTDPADPSDPESQALFPQKPEQEAEHDADQQTGGQGKIKREPRLLDGDIPGQFSQRQLVSKLPENEPGEGENGSDEANDFS
jgi:hypothetical protein